MQGRRCVESSSGGVQADDVVNQILQDYYIHVKQHRDDYNEHECLVIIDIVLSVLFFFRRAEWTKSINGVLCCIRRESGRRQTKGSTALNYYQQQ